MSEPFGVKVLQDENSPAGQVTLRVTGVERAPLDDSFIIRRADDQAQGLGSDWPSGARAPISSEWHEGSQTLELVVGPDVVNPIPGGTPVIIRLPGLANRETAVAWPDGLLLAVTQNRRRGQGRREVAVPTTLRDDTRAPPAIPFPPPPPVAPVATPAPRASQAPSPSPTPMSTSSQGSTATPGPGSISASMQTPRVTPAATATPSQSPPLSSQAPASTQAPASSQAPAPPTSSSPLSASSQGPTSGQARPVNALPTSPPLTPRPGSGSAPNAPIPPPGAAARAVPPRVPGARPPDVPWDGSRSNLPRILGIVAAVVLLAIAGYFGFKTLSSSHSTGPGSGVPKIPGQLPPHPQPQPPPPPPQQPEKTVATPAPCSGDRQAEYDQAMGIYFKEKREAKRLLTCVTNGPDDDLTDKAKRQLAGLQQ